MPLLLLLVLVAVVLTLWAVAARRIDPVAGVAVLLTVGLIWALLAHADLRAV